MAQTVERDVTVSGKSRRILTLDLLRGFFLLVIMIDHVELYPSGWDLITGRGRLWVSAAEGFFFMSGLLIGMIYKRRLHLGMKFIFKKMWTRALELYAAGLAFTFLFLCWVEFTHHAPIKDMLPSPFPWHHYIGEALLMRFTYGWADFLVRFALLMFIAPFAFYLVSRGKWWLMLSLSIGAWLFRGDGFTLSWQLIFNLAILVGFYWDRLQALWRRQSQARRRQVINLFSAAALTSFLLSYASVYLLTWLNEWYGSLTPWLRHLTFTWNNYNADIWVYAQKWTMGPLRLLLFFIWFPVLYGLFRRYETGINRLSRGLLEMLGRNSLFVYSAHAVIIFVMKMYFIPAQTGLLQNFLITLAGLVLLVAVTWLYVNRLRPRLVAA
jgi:hypothetical protein